jgi:predicted deacylase
MNMAIESICSVELPVGEVLNVRKNRFEPKDGKSTKRFSIVTGIHGDELEGQFVCFEVARRIREHPEFLTGIVDIYPAMNPLGIDSMTRGIPGFDLDMNRIFPGSRTGAMTEYVAHKIIEDLSGSDLCVDIHASNIFLTEIPQIRINELHKKELVPLAKLMNVDYVWIHGASTVLESTLAYSLNSTGTPTLVVEMGVGMRITKEYCRQLVEGIFYTMKKMGIWRGETTEVREPIVAEEADSVVFFNAPCAGIFVPSAKHWELLEAGDEVGYIADPLKGEVLSRIVTEDRGLLFTIREYPVVGEGSLVGRLLKRPEK